MAKQRPAQIILLDFAQAGLVIERENDRIGATGNQRAEMLGADASVTTGQNDRALDKVAQFPDIARPVVGRQQLERVGAQLALDAAGEALQKVLGEQRSVLAPLAQWRHADHEAGQTEIEIAAKVSGLAHFAQFTVAGDDKAYVRPQCPGAAQAAEGIGFQHAQQLGLNRRAGFADFIEKQRAPLRLFDQALLLPVGSGEGATLMAKNFGFEQGFLQGSAVDRHHLAAASGAAAMQGLGDHFLPGAGFALNQHGCVGGRDGLDQVEDFLHGARIADQRPRAPGFQLPPVERIATAEFRAVEFAADDDLQFIEPDRLGQILDGAGLDQADRVADRPVTGQDDYRILGGKGFHELRRIGIRQFEIEKDQVRLGLQQPLRGLLPVERTHAIQPEVGNLLDQKPIEDAVIIDHQNLLFHFTNFPPMAGAP